MSDTATSPALQVGVVRGHSPPEVSNSVMAEPGASPDRAPCSASRTVADLAVATHGQREATLGSAAPGRPRGSEDDDHGEEDSRSHRPARPR